MQPEPVTLPDPAADGAARALWARVCPAPAPARKPVRHCSASPARPRPGDTYARRIRARVLWGRRALVRRKSRVCPAPAQAPALALGARCVSVRNVPGRWCYVAPAVYQVAARKTDGALYWRCVDVAPVGRFRSGTKARRAAVELATEMGVPVMTVRHGGRV